MAINAMFLKGRTHDLGRMSLADLVKVYFTYPAVIVYVVVAAISSAAAVILASTIWPLALAAVLAGLIYPLVWYTLHRFVLHGRFLYKNSLTAPLWKRIHFDHHQDPHDLRILFGALYTTLPTVALVTLPIGWLIGGAGGALAAFAGGVVTTCFYEFCHCVQHLNHMPRWPLLRRMKRLHLAHHFHNETGNFGITNFLWDRFFRTLYERPRDVPRSPTTFNLGYTEAEAEHYPWVADLSGGIRNLANARTNRAGPAHDAPDGAQETYAGRNPV